MEKLNKKFNRLFYVGVLVASILFLIVGNRIVSVDSEQLFDDDNIQVYSAIITEIVDRTEDRQVIESMRWNDELQDIETYFRESDSTNINVTFRARITTAARRGQYVTGEQIISDMFDINEREVSQGNRILLGYDDFHGYFFMTYQRINAVVILGILFLLLMILFGKKKGFNSIVALGFVCMAVFTVFVPAILSGRNIYLAAFVIVIYSIVSTLLIVIGPNRKAVSAMLGCIGGVLFAGLLMFIMNNIVQLTGFVDHETRTLLQLNLENPISLQAIIFAGIILGSAGAIMDVAMSISSSLWEVKLAGGSSNFRDIFKSGTEIGKDILGTMLNTLILAYIGSSLSVILLINAHAGSMVELFNMEMIIVEFLRAIVGSFGMFLTIPLTAAICAWAYLKYRGSLGEKTENIIQD